MRLRRRAALNSCRPGRDRLKMLQPVPRLRRPVIQSRLYGVENGASSLPRNRQMNDSDQRRRRCHEEGFVPNGGCAGVDTGGPRRSQGRLGRSPLATLFAVTPRRRLHSISIESAMWLQLSARTLTPLFDLRQQPDGCVSDSDELVCNRLLLTEEFGRLSLGRSQPGA